MFTAPNSTGSASRLSKMMTSDFCPWINRYVYWLKQPIGWFAFATLASVLVGVFLGPIGWTIAVGLVSLMVLGLTFPWLATRCMKCRIRPVHDLLHERQTSEFELTITNHLPIPIIGLTLERYFDDSYERSDLVEQAPSLGLGLERIPALSTAVFRLPVKPEYRGIHPSAQPILACAFPLGIWTARREVGDFSAVCVLPLLVPITEELQLSGMQMAELGAGQRASDHGDFLGVRDFRRGDSLKSIHWSQSARLDQLVICERGGPQKQAIKLLLQTGRSLGDCDEARENLAWRVRITAGLVDLLAARHLPFQLFVDAQLVPLSNGAACRLQALRYLALVPHDCHPESDGTLEKKVNRTGLFAAGDWIKISALSDVGQAIDSGLVRIEACLKGWTTRESICSSLMIDLDQDISTQLDRWLLELGHANCAA